MARKFKTNIKGFNALRNSAGVQAELMNYAKSICSAANGMNTVGGSYVADVQPGKIRAHALVKTADEESAADNTINNTLRNALWRY